MADEKLPGGAKPLHLHPSSEPFAIYYRKINPRCGLCGAPATAIRVTVAVPLLEAAFLTLCDACVPGDQTMAFLHGMQQREDGSGDFIAPDVLDFLSAALASAAGGAKA